MNSLCTSTKLCPKKKNNAYTYATYNIKIEYFTILNLVNLVNELNIEFFKFTLLLL